VSLKLLAAVYDTDDFYSVSSLEKAINGEEAVLDCHDTCQGIVGCQGSGGVRTLTSRFQKGIAMRPISRMDAGSSISATAHVGSGILYGLRRATSQCHMSSLRPAGQHCTAHHTDAASARAHLFMSGAVMRKRMKAANSSSSAKQ